MDSWLESAYEDRFGTPEHDFWGAEDDDRYEDDSDSIVECPSCGAFLGAWEQCDCEEDYSQYIREGLSAFYGD